MHIDFDNYEYNAIVKDILDNREFKKLEGYKHHRINRFEHWKRVSFYAYKFCKKLLLDYVSASRGGTSSRLFWIVMMFEVREIYFLSSFGSSI